MADRILVVDDERPIAEILKFSFEREGFEVEMAFDGEEAVAKARASHFDLVILDIMLPKLDGFSVCKEIRRFSTVPILMLTAKEDEVDKVLGLELGADDYVTKPFSPRELIARVRAILRRTRVAEAGRPGAVNGRDPARGRHHHQPDELRGAQGRPAAGADPPGVRTAPLPDGPRRPGLLARRCWRRSGATTTTATCAPWT